MLSRKRLTVYLFIIAFLFNIGIGFTYLTQDEKNSSETFGNILTQPKISISHSEIIITNDSELDAFCAGNGTSGTSWETAHVIENYEINGTIGDGISIKNTRRYLIINNCKVNDTTSDGINLNNCTNVKIQNCIIELNTGHGIGLFDSEGILISDTDILNNQDEGMRLENTNNSEIIKSNISHNGKDGIYGHINCHNISFTENFIFDNSYGIMFNTLFSYLSFIDNEICNNSGNGILLDSVNHQNIIKNNVICNNSGDGLELYECNSSIVENNIVMNNDGDGLDMWGGDNGGNYNFISNNTFSNNTVNGILFDDSNHHNIVENNEICFNEENGIYMTDDQNNNTISFNNISYNAYFGIILESQGELERACQNSTIFGNSIDYNDWGGIYIDDYCDNNVIKYNLFNDNSNGIELTYNNNNSLIGNVFYGFGEEWGIYVYDCNSTKIFGNNASFNLDYGIGLSGCNLTQVWMNFIRNNSWVQGSDDSLNNLWDNGTVGNYWGDYLVQYPGASAIGNIWDTNYTIDGIPNANDTKPLVNIDPVLDLVPSGNIIYGLGETGHSISWTVTDIYYWNAEYYIYLDEVLVKTGDWVSGDLISLNVDGLDVGTHSFRIIAYDGTAWGKNENTIEVEVGIIPDSPVFITQSQTINYTNITVQWGAVNFTDVYNIYINDTYEGNMTFTEYLLEFNNTGEYVIEITAQNEYGESIRSLSISIIVEELKPNNLFWYFFGGGWILVAGFIGVAFVKVKLKK
jgi:parallel beta-helix repeat protein